MRLLCIHTGASLLALALSSSLHAAPGNCGSDYSAYSGYTITSVRVRNVIGIFTPLTPGLAGIEKHLLLQTNGKFDITSFSEDAAFITHTVQASSFSRQQPLKIVATNSGITSCDGQSLSVVYTVFTNVFGAPTAIPSSPPTLEQQEGQPQREILLSKAAESNTRFTPLTGYDQTRGTTGGFRLISNLPNNTRLQAESAVSTQSLTGEASLNGQSRGAVWTAAFNYRDLPAGSARTEEGKFVARASRTSGIFHYGTAFEAGHQQASGLPASIARLSPDSSLGALKFYGGVTARRGENDFAISGGAQFGSTMTAGTPVFKKWLFDATYHARVSNEPRDDDLTKFNGPLKGTLHRALNVQTRFSAGLISNLAATPFAERFFGGNQLHSFVADDALIIPSDAYIRSIPENRLGSSGTNLGGSRFYAANLTLSWPVWGRPVIPQDLATDEFLHALNFSYGTAIGVVADQLKSADPTFTQQSAGLRDQAAALGTTLQALARVLNGINASSNPELAAALGQSKTDRLLTSASVSLIRSGQFPPAATLVVSLPKIEDNLSKLIQALNNASMSAIAAQVDPLRAAIDKSRQDISTSVAALQTNKYNDQAARQLQPAHRAMSVFLHELNIYAISPVAIFDAARVWPTATGTRYAVGGGLRFTLVNVNLTAAYAWNPQRASSEKPGAVFFKLDVTNYFR